jgi:RNA polymerase sigma factor for flagellar operon FliA
VSPERARRRVRTQGSPPATAKRGRRPLARPQAAETQESSEEQAKAELADTLITKYSGLVRQIAGGFQRKLPRNVLRDDLIAAGMSGLWDAVRKHGHEQTENFDDVSETEQARCLTAGESTNTEKAVEARLVKATLTRAMDQLPERERRIVSMHYFRGVKFKDLGEMLGVSEPRISQLHSRAMTRLKGILESDA